MSVMLPSQLREISGHDACSDLGLFCGRRIGAAALRPGAGRRASCSRTARISSSSRRVVAWIDVVEPGELHLARNAQQSDLLQDPGQDVAGMKPSTKNMMTAPMNWPHGVTVA